VKRWLKIFLTAAKNWNADNAIQYAAAVSFSTLFSLAPITIIAVTVAGVFFGRDTAAREFEKQITALVGPASAEMVSAAVKATETTRTSTWSTIAGVALMLFGATAVFAQLQSSLNQIWHVRTKPSKSGWLVLVMQRLLSFAMVLTLGFLLMVSLVISTAVATVVERFGGTLFGSTVLLKAVDLGVGLVIITVLFALLFKVLPDVKVRWREVWMGAAVTAVLFTVGRYLIALYLAHSTVASVYGTAGSLVALLVWVYYSCAILFYGGEFIRAYRQAHHRKTEPKETAVLVREAVVETEVASPR
jgi:membrane protein